jgi:hypothetical protein
VGKPGNCITELIQYTPRVCKSQIFRSGKRQGHHNPPPVRIRCLGKRGLKELKEKIGRASGGRDALRGRKAKKA